MPTCFTLPNGLRVVTERLPGFRSVSVGLWVGAGSEYERAQSGGMSHFIEHMLFKGTKKRTARQLAEEIDAVGGQMNAFTAKECTCFYVKVVDEDLPLAMDVLSDMTLSPTFPKDELEKEKGVVLEEIAMAEDTPEDVVSELIMRSYYGDQPLARPILGEAETVSGFTRARAVAYYQKMYRPDRCVLAVAGNFDEAMLADLCEKYFGDWATSDAPAPAFASKPPKPRILRREKDIEQLHLCVAYPAFPDEDDALYPLSLLSSVFGGAASSRLFQTIREEKGLAYSVYSYPSAYADTGLLIVYAGTNIKTGTDVLSLIAEEVEKLKARGLTEQEFLQARSQLKGSYVLGLESTSSRMSALGRRMLLRGDMLAPEEAIARIEAITPAQVADVTQRVFSGARAAALVGRGVDGVEVVI